jgi:transcriptional regulator
MVKTPSRRAPDRLHGGLDVLVLQALSRGRQHGFGVARWIEHTAGDALSIEEGSLYPALHRLERRGFVSSAWAVSENNRRARYYSLTPSGRRYLAEERRTWSRLASAIIRVLRAT